MSVGAIHGMPVGMCSCAHTTGILSTVAIVRAPQPHQGIFRVSKHMGAPRRLFITSEHPHKDSTLLITWATPSLCLYA